MWVRVRICAFWDRGQEGWILGEGATDCLVGFFEEFVCWGGGVKEEVGGRRDEG